MIVIFLLLSLHDEPSLQNDTYEVSLVEFNTVVNGLGFVPLRQIIYRDSEGRILGYLRVDEFPKENKYGKSFSVGPYIIKYGKIIRTFTDFDPEQLELHLNEQWKRPGLYPKRPPRKTPVPTPAG